MSYAGIVPPYLLRAVADRGDAEQRALALQALRLDASLRSRRQRRADATAPPDRPAAGATPGTQPRRTVYDCGHADTDPPTGPVARSEGAAATGDPATDEAYDGLGTTFGFYRDAYQRNSLDDAGLPLDGYVHFGTDYPNAFFDGREMVFGDGIPGLFNRFTSSLDVIAHELTHGVTADEAQLVYRGQSGALNESISDVFGSLVKQYARNQSAEQADWLIGVELLAPGVHGRALRDMAHPGTAYDDPRLGTDPQPTDMAHYVETDEDDGGVHLNSGIPNRAFYLTATALGGRAWRRPAASGTTPCAAACGPTPSSRISPA